MTAILLAAGGCGEPGVGGDRTSGAVTGVVLAAPACPVETVDKPCPPRAVASALVEALEGNHVRASTRTEDDGGFRLELPHGIHVIRATITGGLASTASEQVKVSGVPVNIELVVDSGIR